ncbi:phospholipase [Thermoleophilia bacterium SCSIO 60948]|nr:phospholipase [Thermoleophilia bacterium SCSIO 60948]
MADLVHRLREPDGDPEGALILNHGRGSDENDLFGLLDELDPERRLLGVTTGAPLTGIPPGGRHWYVVPRVGYPEPRTFASSLAMLDGFIDRLLAERGIAPERTVIGGFSMGSVMSYATGLGPGRPRPAGIIAMSGFVPTVEGWEPELEGREGLPVLIAHGRQDPVIEFGFADRAAALLEPAGLDVRRVSTETGHWVAPEALDAGRELVAEALA